MKIVRLRNNVTVVFSDGSMLSNSNCTDELYNNILSNQENEEQVKAILLPEFFSKKQKIETKTKLLSQLSNSTYLTVAGNSIYIKSISELTVPEDLAVAFYKAEKENNQELINTYLNFWTLCSLNPDSRARTNLFWFLNKYGMTISKSGLFVAYRNVRLKSEGTQINTKLAKVIANYYTKVKFKWKKSPAKFTLFQKCDEDNISKDKFELTKKSKPSFKYYRKIDTLDNLYLKLSEKQVAPVYTDSFSNTFSIKIGQVVSMPRNQCDAVQEHTCSTGLHVAGKEWLSGNSYFGKISLMVLVNPADVVAVPPDDDYGKMRVCAYYPVEIVDRDKEGNIIDKDINDGFEDDFMHLISYQGTASFKDGLSYTVFIPSIPEIDRSKILSRLDEIKEKLKNKHEN